MLRELNAQTGLTLVVATQDPEVEAQYDRVVRSQDGVVVGEERLE